MNTNEYYLLTEEEFNKLFPEENCKRHGKFRAVCMECEKEDDARKEWEAQKAEIEREHG